MKQVLTTFIGNKTPVELSLLLLDMVLVIILKQVTHSIA